jgi:hypothetical protein
MFDTILHSAEVSSVKTGVEESKPEVAAIMSNPTATVQVTKDITETSEAAAITYSSECEVAGEKLQVTPTSSKLEAIVVTQSVKAFDVMVVMVEEFHATIADHESESHEDKRKDKELKKVKKDEEEEESGLRIDMDIMDILTDKCRSWKMGKNIKEGKEGGEMV